MTKEEILDLALRYIEEDEVADFPQKDELFCFLNRDVPNDRVLADEEGWRFGGYALCTGYQKDYESKPAGKWIWFNYITLNTFPPAPEVTKLQPPHIAKGLYSSPDRSMQIRIVKMMPDSIYKMDSAVKGEENESKKDNIIEFPGNKK